MPKTLREQLEESFENEEQKAGGSEEDTEESLGDSGEEEEEEEKEQGSEDKDSDEGGTEDDEQVPSEEDAEGDGKPSDGEEDDEKEEGEEDDGISAPVSWKPAVREHWKGLPKEVKEEVLRRETEISRGLKQASGHRKLAEEYAGVVRPFENLIRAQNSTPSQAITNLMTTAARLTMGTPTQKAQVISEIIKNYAVDIELLDNVLADVELPNTENDALLQQIDQRIKPLSEFVSHFQTAQNRSGQEAELEAQQELETFSTNPKNEFFDDVREDMADILELNARRGREVSLEDAYNLACQNNPEVKKVLDHRAEKAKASKDKGDDIGNKRKASSSIASDGPAGGKADATNRSLRGDILAAVEDLEER